MSVCIHRSLVYIFIYINYLNDVASVAAQREREKETEREREGEPQRHGVGGCGSCFGLRSSFFGSI